jgi:hypothetical protein
MSIQDGRGLWTETSKERNVSRRKTVRNASMLLDDTFAHWMRESQNIMDKGFVMLQRKFAKDAERS